MRSLQVVCIYVVAVWLVVLTCHCVFTNADNQSAKEEGKRVPTCGVGKKRAEKKAGEVHNNNNDQSTLASGGSVNNNDQQKNEQTKPENQLEEKAQPNVQVTA
jgi:hypothetical protein